MIDRFEAHVQAMQMLSRAQEVTADNLANLQTPGFKGGRFIQRLEEVMEGGETTTRPTGQTSVEWRQGVLEASGNPMDLAIDGEGFFVVERDGEPLLTRNGRFHLNPDGELIDSRGGRVVGTGGPIQIPEMFHGLEESGSPVELEISADGTLRAHGEVQGRLQLARVNDPATLQRKGEGYFDAASADLDWGNETGEARILQGYVEKSNVEPLHEMVSMMKTMQLFEAQQRALRSSDEMLGQANQTLGRF